MNEEKQKSELGKNEPEQSGTVLNGDKSQAFLKNTTLSLLDILSFISLSFVVFGILTIGFLVAPVVFKNLTPRSLASEIMTDLFFRFYPLAFITISITFGSEVLKFLLLSKEFLKSKILLLNFLIILFITFLTGYSSNILLPRINDLVIHQKGPSLWTNNEFIILHKRSEDFAKAIFILGLIPLCILVTKKKIS